MTKKQRKELEEMVRDASAIHTSLQYSFDGAFEGETGHLTEALFSLRDLVQQLHHINSYCIDEGLAFKDEEASNG